MDLQQIIDEMDAEVVFEIDGDTSCHSLEFANMIRGCDSCWALEGCV